MQGRGNSNSLSATRRMSGAVICIGCNAKSGITNRTSHYFRRMMNWRCIGVWSPRLSDFYLRVVTWSSKSASAWMSGFWDCSMHVGKNCRLEPIFKAFLEPLLRGKDEQHPLALGEGNLPQFQFMTFTPLRPLKDSSGSTRWYYEDLPRN